MTSGINGCIDLMDEAIWGEKEVAGAKMAKTYMCGCGHVTGSCAMSRAHPHHTPPLANLAGSEFSSYSKTSEFLRIRPLPPFEFNLGPEYLKL